MKYPVSFKFCFLITIKGKYIYNSVAFAAKGEQKRVVVKEKLLQEIFLMYSIDAVVIFIMGPLLLYFAICSTSESNS